MTNVADTPRPMVNGNGKMTWWIIGLLSTIVIGGGSSWVGSVYTQIRHHGERIAVLEAQIQDSRQQLQRINHKLDQLLERQAQRP
jgi:hypothetical protein